MSDLHLSEIIGAPIVATGGQRLGKLRDAVAKLPGQGGYPVIAGLVVKVGRREIYVGARKIVALGAQEIRLNTAELDIRPFERRPGEVLLRRDLLGHRLIDVPAARLVRAHDVEVSLSGRSWQVTGVDTVARRRLFGLLSTSAHAVRDWKDFEPLIGHRESEVARGRRSRLTHLRPAQIADLVEEADREETEEILHAVHNDAELEADVFEEMETDRQVEVLRERSDAEVADVLMHMRADDAADLIAELPQDRRLPLLGLLPVGTQIKIRALLGFNPATAGGMMNPDFLALPEDISVEEALRRVSKSTKMSHEVLVSLPVTRGTTLCGAIGLVALLQADRKATLAHVADGDPVRVHPDADVTEVAIRMTDFNLLAIPVVDDANSLLGVITVDDLLEVTVPEAWRRREDGAATSDSMGGSDPGAPVPPQSAAATP